MVAFWRALLSHHDSSPTRWFRDKGGLHIGMRAEDLECDASEQDTGLVTSDLPRHTFTEEPTHACQDWALASTFVQIVLRRKGRPPELPRYRHVAHHKQELEQHGNRLDQKHRRNGELRPQREVFNSSDDCVNFECMRMDVQRTALDSGQKQQKAEVCIITWN